MKQIIIFSIFQLGIFLAHSASLFSQNIKIIGKVQDAGTAEPLEYATIALRSEQDSSIKIGAVTDVNGKFVVEHVKPGKYFVQIDFIGYYKKTIEKVYPIQDGQVIDLKTIGLSAALEKSKDSVEITAERGFVIQHIDKKVFTADQSLVSQGGNATDLLTQLPSVAVDMDGVISLRGSENVNILINGKPSGLTGANLSQIPASSIESIELITNPSAKYDPDGTSGIINIILKKSTKPGYNGSVSLGIGSNRKYNGSASFNLQKGKFSLFSNYSYRYDTRYRYFNGDRQTLGENPVRIIQQADAENLSQTHVLRLGSDYNLTKKDVIGVSFTGNLGTKTSWENRTYSFYDGNALLTQIWQKHTNEDEPSQTFDLNAYFKHTFRPKSTLNIDLTHSNNKANNDFYSILNYYDPQNQLDTSLTPFNQQNIVPSSIQTTTFMADFSHVMKEKYTLEAGYKTILRNWDNNQQSTLFNYTNSEYENNVGLTNHFKYNEGIHSLYASLAGNWKKLAYKAGLRAEQTYRNGNLVTTGQTFSTPYFNVFPSAFLNYEINDKWKVNAAYSMRINRPSPKQLNPFDNVADPLSIRMGNPYLEPEYVHSMEIGFGTYIKQTSLNSTFYYRQINNAFSRYLVVDSSGAARVTSVNLLGGYNWGWEFNWNGNILKWWSISLNTNLFQNTLNADNLGTYNSSLINYSFRLINNIKLGKTWDIQLSGNYTSPRNTPQGKMFPTQSWDLAVRKKLLKNKLILAVNGSDLTNATFFGVRGQDYNFKQEFKFKRETRVFMLTATWNFGKSEFKPRQPKKEETPIDGGGGGF